MKYLIVGLGNPGAEYAETRHNIGFKALDVLARTSNAVFSPSRLGDIAEIKYKARTLILCKPSTYMNLSGKAINYWMQHESIPPERIMVITDDLALPFGKIRLRGKGSDGGHNGLKSVQESIGSQEYARLRFGVGAEFQKGQQVNYVLSPWTSTEAAELDERLELVKEAVMAFCTLGLARAMNMFNNR